MKFGQILVYLITNISDIVVWVNDDVYTCTYIYCLLFVQKTQPKNNQVRKYAFKQNFMNISLISWVWLNFSGLKKQQIGRNCLNLARLAQVDKVQLK